jgi:predicted nucleic acid-binding protein
MRNAAAFWDASALIPICVQQVTSHIATHHLRRLQPVVWWATPVEIQGAISRLYREEAIGDAAKRGAITRLEMLRKMWREIAVEERLRELAMELSDRHPLKAGDSLQLAASLIWCDERPTRRSFVCADRKLSKVAQSIGFSVIEIHPTSSRA